MEEDAIVEETPAPQPSVGERLREARLAQGLELDEVATETRIPLRHLESIEEGQFSDLPSRTYAIGFTRTYARKLGLDERELLDGVRAELAESSPQHGPNPEKFEPGDPARVPGRGLAWFAVLAAILLIGGIYAFYSSYFAPGMGPAPLQSAEETGETAAGPAPAAQATAAAVPSGPVVFTNTEDGTWVRFYDAEGEILFDGIMKKGDTFTIPADAKNPQIRTGRPYAFDITIGGKAVPKITEEVRTVSDVPVSAEALLAREAAPQAGATTGATPLTASQPVTPTAAPAAAVAPVATQSR